MRHSRLRRRDLAKPFHGVRAASDDTFSERCAAAQTRFDERHFFSHTTAARILGLPLPAREEDASTLHVAVVPPFRAPKSEGVIGHQLRVDPASIRERGGLRIPGAVEVWCELAATLALDELVQAGDALVRRNAPLSDVDQLESAVRGARHRPGVRRMHDALALIRPRTDSPMETVLRLALVRAGLPEPLVNPPLTDAAGAFVAFGDLVYERDGIVIEYDGEQHRLDAAQYAADVDRLWRIESLGWRVIRVNRSHLRDGGVEAVRRVRAALSE
ncbi:hypothetical protein GCM10027406_13000 [Leifsonia lichenia]